MQTEIGRAFTPGERNAVIRYALSVGTRAKCATRWLLRPLKMRDLQAAIREREAGHRNTIETYTRRAAEYRAGKTPCLPRRFPILRVCRAKSALRPTATA